MWFFIPKINSEKTNIINLWTNDRIPMRIMLSISFRVCCRLLWTFYFCSWKAVPAVLHMFFTFGTIEHLVITLGRLIAKSELVSFIVLFRVLIKDRHLGYDNFFPVEYCICQSNHSEPIMVCPVRKYLVNVWWLLAKRLSWYQRPEPRSKIMELDSHHGRVLAWVILLLYDLQ